MLANKCYLQSIQINKEIVMYKFIIFIVLIVTASTTVSAAVYKCAVDGVTQYSQIPCGNTVEEVTGLNNNIPIKKIEYNKLPIDKDYTVKVYIINSKIRRAKSSVEKHQRNMVEEINILKERTYNANNNLAGAIYHDALSREMVVVTNKYKSLISKDEATISHLKEQLTSIKN